MEARVKARLLAAIVATALGAGLLGACAPRTIPPVKHIFVVNLENKGFTEAFGPGSPATYLNTVLRPSGQLLDQYYGVAHNSLPNYIAQISGQGANPQTQGDCQVYSEFAQVGRSGGQAVGDGCVYPSNVQTLADQMTSAGLKWKGYMEDMGNTPGQPTTCRHPALNSPDSTQTAKATDMYAARHNPLVYFHSIIDKPICASNDLPLDRLPADLHSTKTTPNLVYITPNLCNDGHDATCADGRVGGLVAADAWLRTWIPKILASAAFKHDGMLVVTFDEAEATGSSSDASSCCGEGPGPNSPLPGITGLGGGRVGAVVVSRWTRPGFVNATPYNHYSLLRSIEDLFGLSHLGYADSSDVHSFGFDVFDATPTPNP
jgi:phospholipase C